VTSVFALMVTASCLGPFQKSSTWNHCDPHAPIQQISNRVHHPHPPFHNSLTFPKVHWFMGRFA